MLDQALIAAGLTLATVAIHGLCTAVILRVLQGARPAHWMLQSLSGNVTLVGAIVLLLLGASLLEAWIWSLAYLATGAIEGAEQAIYFSIVTFTTLGYGDVVLAQGFRLLGALQAAAGIIVFGWTTALVIAVLQRLAQRVVGRPHVE